MTLELTQKLPRTRIHSPYLNREVPLAPGTPILLTTARWLHQRDANAKFPLGSTAWVLAMATTMAALVGALVTPKLALVTAALPPAHALKTLLTRKLKHREALRALQQTPPELIQQVQQHNAEIITNGTRYEIHTPRKIQTLYVLHADEFTLTHLDYPEWHPKGAPEVEALVKKARPC